MEAKIMHTMDRVDIMRIQATEKMRQQQMADATDKRRKSRQAGKTTHTHATAYTKHTHTHTHTQPETALTRRPSRPHHPCAIPCLLTALAPLPGLNSSPRLLAACLLRWASLVLYL